ncbi:MAG: UPF0175 family protein [bacterium]
MHTVTLQLSDELVKLAKLKREHLSRDALKLLVLELYREEIVSLGKAAELCGLSLSEFMEFSASRKVPLHYGKTELEQDRQYFAKIEK